MSQWVIYGVPEEIFAKAFAKVIPAYWRTQPGSNITLIWLCLFEKDFAEFRKWLGPK